MKIITRLLLFTLIISALKSWGKENLFRSDPHGAKSKFEYPVFIDTTKLEESPYLRIRIGQKAGLPITITKTAMNADINKVNTNGFIFPGELLSQLSISYPGIGKTINWPAAAGHITPSVIERFKSAVEKDPGLLVDIDYDPALLKLVAPNNFVDVMISYTYSSDPTSYPLQKKIRAHCFIDNDGVITLPSLYQFAFPNYDVNIADPVILYDALDNTLKLKLFDPTTEATISITEAEKRITSFYSSRVIPGVNLKDIKAAITPGRELVGITVITKNRTTILPYAKESLGNYLKNSYLRRLAGVKGKCLKVELYIRAGVALPSQPVIYHVHVGKDVGPELIPGSIIYLKRRFLWLF